MTTANGGVFLTIRVGIIWIGLTCNPVMSYRALVNLAEPHKRQRFGSRLIIILRPTSVDVHINSMQYHSCMQAIRSRRRSGHCSLLRKTSISANDGSPVVDRSRCQCRVPHISFCRSAFVGQAVRQPTRPVTTRANKSFRDGAYSIIRQRRRARDHC